MIFVTVGTQKFQFNRLIHSIDKNINIGKISDTVFAQIGNSSYIPQNFSFQRFLSAEEYNEKMSQCDIVVSHSGVATIVKGIQLGKKVIVVPRLKEYGEHVDDHQRQIAEAFAKQNYIVQCLDVEELPNIIRNVKLHEFAAYQSQRTKVINIIENFLKTSNGP